VQLPARPVGVIDSLARGFETLAGQPALLTPPLILDLVLWIGPRLSIRGFALPAVEGYFDALTAQAIDAPGVAQTLGQLREWLGYQVAHFNALSALITAPLGAPSLMGWLAPEGVPEGVSPPIWELGDLGTALLIMIALALIGFLVGAIYLGLMANQVRSGQLRARALLRALPRYWLNVVGLALITLSALLIVSLPFLGAFWCMSAIDPLIGMIGLIVGMSVGLWVLVFLSFAVHAMMLKDRSLFQAIGDSVRVVQSNTPPTVLLLTLVTVVYVGVGFLCRLPEPDSWLRLVGLVLHAFVVTGLFVATFVYYQDRFRHYEEFRAYLARSG
jgi:hypothetical protein